MKLKVLGTLLLVLIAIAPMSASTIFSDNFDSYNGGVGALNFTNFGGNWNVGGGTVDLIGNGFFDFIPGNGLYIDLDGSSNQSGLLSHNFSLNPGTYTLQFALAGTHRGTTDSVTVSLSGGLYSEVFTLASNDPLTTITRTITVASATNTALGFQDASSNNIGILLDDVSFSDSAPVPEPSSLVLLGSGLMSAAGLVRRKFSSR
jgi:hypothetical protein